MAPRRSRPATTLLLLLAACLFLTTARAASTVLGLDLGTAYLKAVLVKPGIPLDIVLTKDSKRKEAAALAFKPGATSASSADSSFPERLYGGDALALAGRFPGDVYANLKPLLGLAADDAGALAPFRARYPGLKLEKCPERDAICFRSAAFGAGETAFAVEELLGMQLQNVRANAEAFAGPGAGAVRDAVITIPAYYTMKEKAAVKAAAELAGLNVLAMTTDGLAVGLNYATTRTFPTVNEGGKPEYHLVYDMGAGSATATVLRFQGRTVKDIGRFNKTIQEVQVMGAGWDQSLGGDALNAVILDDMIHKLAKVKAIEKLGAGPAEIRAHARTVAKLWKEAERLRQVLSANSETQASFEGIYDDDVNFKYKLTRADFEKMAVDYAQRVSGPIAQALEMAKLEAADVESVILHGGAVRTPFVQKALEAAIGKAEKLRTNVNSDEAAAFGAAFKAAGTSPSFRVKEIRAVEAALQPVMMAWEQSGMDRHQKLFVPTSAVGVGKQVPVRQTTDFAFDLLQVKPSASITAESHVVSQGQTTNLTASLKDLGEKFACEQDTTRAHMLLRLSPEDGLPEVVNGSVSCESKAPAKGAGVVGGMKGLFGWNKKGDQQVLEEAAKDAEPTAKPSKPSKAKAKSDKKAGSKSADASASASADKDTAEATVGAEAEAKPKTVSAPFGLTASKAHTPLSAIDSARIQERMKAFDKSDSDRKLREEALNSLEGYTYRVRDLVDDEAFAAVSAAKERAAIQAKGRAASDWLYGDGADAAYSDYKFRLSELQGLVDPIQRRRDEAAQRPEQIQALRSSIQQTKSLLETLRETAQKAAEAKAELAKSEAAARTETTTPPADSAEASGTASEATLNLDDLDDDPFAAPAPEMPPMPDYSEAEMDKLTRAYEDVEAWLKAKEAAQAKLAPTEEPAVLVRDVKAKGEELNKLIFEILSKQMSRQRPGSEKNKGGGKSKSKTDKAKTKTKGKGKGKGKDKEATAAETATAAESESQTKATDAGPQGGRIREEL